MKEGLNRVQLLGTLGADPELRHTQGGQAVLNIRMVTNETYLDRDKVRKEKSEWHNVVVWGNRAEALAKFLEKGRNVYIEGSLRTSSYDDREGNKRYKTEINAQNVILIPGGGGERQSSGTRSAASGARKAVEAADEYGADYGGNGQDDIPF